jgi:hypothetical protein
MEGADVVAAAAATEIVAAPSTSDDAAGSSASAAAAAPGDALAAQVLMQLQRLTGPRQLEVKVPVIGFQEYGQSWTHPAWVQKRNQCPLKDDDEAATRFDLSEFSKYLAAYTNQRDEISRRYTLQAVRRFYGMLKVEGRMKGVRNLIR